MVPWFIENGIDPHIIGDNNETLLFDAGDGKAVRYLLEKGLDPNHKNEFGRLALFTTQDEASVQAMIEYGLDLEKVEKETEQAVILTMIGNFAGEGALKAVLESGKVDTSPATLQSALVLAAHFDNDKLIRFLVQYGADVNQPEVRMRSDGAPDSTMPLMATTLGDQAKAAKVLLELGADPNGGDHSGQFLKNAMANGCQKVAKLLREAGAKGVGDLAYQIVLRDEAAIQALLEKAPSYDTSPEFWDRVMVEAARTGHRGVIEAALQKGVPLFKDRKFMCSSDNPYRTAAAEGQHEVLELLIAPAQRGGRGHMAEGRTAWGSMELQPL
ncbi:MAG: hypothetical protein HC901_01845 [Bdellovibrionaceae bacterium]|nr:hypothetical protein [Pseudobdellovibrionaceae bacterium]